MSLASPYQEQYYVADGVTTSFAFGQGFTALNEIDIKCIIYFEDGTDCVPVFNVNTVTGYINIVTLTKPDGTVLTVPPAGSIVRIFRDTPEAQNVTASQLQNYTAKQLERVFDSIVAMIQEISYSDQHKTIRLTETQRDIAIDYLPNDKDQAVIYWDMESRKLMPAGFGQNQVVKSDGIEWLVYDNSEGKIYYVPREGGNPIPVGKATIHNDLSGRNAPDCHPESAITGLTQDLQELRDKDLALDEDVQTALNRSQEAKDTADEAKETAEYAQSQVAEAKEMAIDAKETAESVEGIAQEAKDIADEALDKVTQEITDREDADGALQDQITINKGTMDTHIANTNNPHQVTKTQVGLGNVDNTSDLDKPISTATQAALDLKMPTSTKYGAALSLTINSTNYVVTAQLKDQDGNNLGTVQTIDLPLESVVVSGAYDSATKEVVLTLQDGSKIRFSVADLVSGLQTEITALNMLSADLVDDTSTTHKFVTTTEKTTWNGKQNAISDLATIRSNAQAGKAASDTIATYGNIVTHNVSEFATATQGAKADTAVQPSDLGNGTITITQGGITKGTFTTNQGSNATIALDAGGGGGVDIDNSTITKNGSDQLQAVATINANSATGATNPVYDWVGTLAEYTSQAVATNHPDWICYITDDTTAQAYDAYSKSQTDTLLAGKVSTGHEVIEFQAPTAANNYTWYRKYADGWVEQGGIYASAFTGTKTFAYPVEMADTNYTLTTGTGCPNISGMHGKDYITAKTTTGFNFTSVSLAGSFTTSLFNWQVSGMAA